MASTSEAILGIGDAQLDLAAGELRRNGVVVEVEPQVFALIAHLAARPGELVSRDDLIEAVWGGRIVSDSAIATRINAARAALGDDGKAQRVIQTVPRRGFRFVGENKPAPDLSLPDKPSIAVLPFTNMSGDPEQEFFSDGITDDIITELARYDELFVIARHSSFAYKGRSIDLREIARELGVQYILEGGVRRSGGRVRVTAQLIDTTSGNHVWAERYDRELEDIFSVQDEITAVIVNTLVGKVMERHVGHALKARPQAIDAYDHLLRAMMLFQKIDREGNVEARREAEAAIALEPGMARAHAFVSWTLAVSGAVRWTDDQQAAFDAALDAAERAVSCDDYEPWAHAALSYAQMFGQRAHARALASAERAVSLNPNGAHFRAWRAMELCFAEAYDDALSEIRAALRLNPHFPPYYLNFHGRILYSVGRFGDALQPLERGAIAMPMNSSVQLLLAATYVELGRLVEARVTVGKALAASPGYRLSEVHYSVPYSDPQKLERYLGALRTAGMPE